VSLFHPKVPHPELIAVAAEDSRQNHHLNICLNAMASLDESEAGPLLQTILVLQKLLEL
jgi:hypothetical protein